MDVEIKKWLVQIKKGYLELCVLSLIEAHERLYGLQIIKLLEENGIPVKEGTLYPLLSRMSSEKSLRTEWETKKNKGHPRKFYSLSKTGAKALSLMKIEFNIMQNVLNKINESGGDCDKPGIRVLPSET